MKKHVLFIILVFQSLIVFAQIKRVDSLIAQRRTANLAYPLLYKENSELSYTSPLGEIGAPSGYLINGKLTTSYMVLASKNLPIAFSINPDFTVRVREEQSAGVRTPSFKLGGTLYLRLSPNIRRYRYAEVSFTHHSNGQDGKAILPNGEVNTINGNFNTNYLQVGYRLGNDKFHHRFGLQWHKWFAYDPVLNGDYGFTRMNYDFSLRIYERLAHHTEKERWRMNASVSYAINSLVWYPIFAPKKRLNVEISSHYSFPFMQNVFLMAVLGYYGEDPYNIYFKDKYAFLRFGISTTFTRYQQGK